MSDKKVWKKVWRGGTLAVGDMTAEEKRRLFACMVRYGASAGFSYDRFFKEGFLKWEILGIYKIKIDYLHYLKTEEKIDIDIRCVETTTDPQTGEEIHKYRVFYPMQDEEKSIDLNKPGDFWQLLGDLRYRLKFKELMQQMGMRSASTVVKRFRIDDWREYEQVGIRMVVDVFMEELKTE